MRNTRRTPGKRNHSGQSATCSETWIAHLSIRPWPRFTTVYSAATQRSSCSARPLPRDYAPVRLLSAGRPPLGALPWLGRPRRQCHGTAEFSHFPTLLVHACVGSSTLRSTLGPHQRGPSGRDFGRAHNLGTPLRYVSCCSLALPSCARADACSVPSREPPRGSGNDMARLLPLP